MSLTALTSQLAEDEVKAGFIYNFTKFVTWPETASGTLRICGTGKAPLAGKLALLQGREAQGRKIAVDADVTDWRQCDLIYIAAGDPQWFKAILNTVAHQPTLTISDNPDFIQAGGMIGLHLVADRVRFSVNLGAAQRSGLKLSSQLLQLAQEIIP